MKKMLFALILMVPVLEAGGATYSVDCNDPAADFSSIQDAVDFALDGDTIVVKPCTYNENIDFQGKVLEIRSLHPENPSIVRATIISASSGYSVTFAAGETNSSILTGLTITGRGIFCSSSSPVISKNIITNCSNSGITCENNSAPLIRDNLITSNTPSGIRVCHGSIIDNKITHNGPESGIYICYGEVSGNEIAYNFSSNNGGGIYDSDGAILRNVIIHNEAVDDGGGIYISDGTAIQNIIVGNKAGQLGGGICRNSGRVGRNIIAGNRAVLGSAMGVSTGEIHNNTITGNRVEESGTLYECRGYIENNIIAFNEGPTGLGGLYGDNILNSYNCFWENSGSNFGGKAERGDGDLISDPCFAEPGHWDANGTATDPNDDFWVDGDYHVRSEYGRWNDAIKRWVYDAETSPCIDAGFEYWDWKGEYWPHGARINQGRYGGTAEASMSPNDVGSVADLDLDELGLVDFYDLMLLCDAWALDWPLLREDLDRNGVVALTDYAVFVANWAPFPPPSPSPMTWEEEPNEIRPGEVTMLAGPAESSDGGDVEYRFRITSGGEPSYSVWSSWRGYTDTELTEGVSYCYEAQARNVGNKVPSKFSAQVCVVISSPPDPSTMTWAKPPAADDFNSVSMMAMPATSTDGSGVEYNFICTSGGGHNSGWSDSNDYTDIVSENRTYCYKVIARNKGNLLETNPSEERCATTPMAPPPQPLDMTWLSEPAATSYNTIEMTATTAVSADGIGVEYFFWNVTRDPIPDVNNDLLWQLNKPYFKDEGLSRLTTYTYRVMARNAFNKVTNNWSVARSATTPCDDSRIPRFPDDIYWDVAPCECDPEPGTDMKWRAVMRAAEAEDDSSGPLEYRFLCTESKYSSGWQTSRCWDVLIGRNNQGLEFRVMVRDECGNESEMSPLVLLRSCYPDNKCPPDVCDY